MTEHDEDKRTRTAALFMFGILAAVVVSIAWVELRYPPPPLLRDVEANTNITELQRQHFELMRALIDDKTE